MMNPNDEMINLDDVIAETGDTDPFNTNDANQPADNEFVDLEAMVENAPNEQPDADISAVDNQPSPEVEQATQKSLLDYILELAAQNTSNAKEPTTSEPSEEPSEVATNESTTEETVAEETAKQPPSPENLPTDINQLLEEAKNIILNARVTQYAQEQASLIRKEVNDLAAIGIRVTQNEIESIVQDALQKGVEPIEAFRAYAYRLIKIQSITGTPLRPKQTIPSSMQPTTRRTPAAPMYATPAEGEFIPFEQVILELMGEE